MSSSVVTTSNRRRARRPRRETGSLELWFGMDVGKAGSETVAVDFADVRVDLD